MNLQWNPLSIITVSYGLSLIDAYWICPVDSNLTFKEINLFENDFSEVLGLIAFTGYKSALNNFRTSPELSTDGVLPKCWRKESTGIFLYKGGTSGASNTGLEPYSEYYVYQVAHKMGLSSVPYDLKQYKGKLVSVCPLFTTLEDYYVPMNLTLQKGGIEEIIAIYGIQNFSDLCAFDYIIANTDRHLGNFGMIQEPNGVLTKTAPIFDNGLCLFPYLLKTDFKEGAENSMYANVSALTDNLLYLLNQIITSLTKSKVRKLINFKFERHQTYNLPEWRLKALEKFVALRVSNILGK